MADQELLALLRSKDPRGLDKLARCYGPMLRYCMRGILPDPREQEECLSDLLLLVWERIGAYDPQKGALKAWLVTLARNTALNRARSIRQGRVLEELQETLPDPSPTPEELVLQQERARRIQQAADQLPRMDRLLFYRKYYYLQSTAQIAAELGLSPRAVEGRLYRLRQRLRKQLGDEYNG